MTGIERYYGHNDALVVTQSEPGVFSERPMTLAEKLAREPAGMIQDDIYRHANYAGACYYEIWELIASAIQAGINEATQTGNETGAGLIAKERRRQIEEEELDEAHDDEHIDGSLAMVAACYATPVRLYQKNDVAGGMTFFDPWPVTWGRQWDKRRRYGERENNPGNSPPKPSTYTHEQRIDLLIKAGALIAAEIDRLQREQKKKEDINEHA